MTSWQLVATLFETVFLQAAEKSAARNAQQPRGLILSCLKLFYMLAQSWMAHLLRVLFWLASGQLVILDRYFFDYAVDPMRRLVFSHLSISPAAQDALNPGVTWFGWKVPALLEVAVVLGLGLVMLAIAIWEFSTSE